MFGNPKVTNLNIFALFYPIPASVRAVSEPDTDGLLVLKLLN